MLLQNEGREIWEGSDSLRHLSVLVNKLLQQSRVGNDNVTGGLETSGMKICVTPPGNRIKQQKCSLR